MEIQNNVYEYHNQRTLCVVQDVLIDLGLLTYDNLQNYCRKERKKLNRLRTAGNGRTGLIEWASIREDFRQKIIKAFGDPYRRNDVRSFINRLENDEAAARFLQKARISDEKQLQYYTEAQILNLYGKLLQEIEIKKLRNPSFKKTKKKTELSKIIAELKLQKHPNGKKKYPHKLPSNPRALERRYKDYNEDGVESLIHGGVKNSYAKKIKGAVADWILATYCLPHKPKTPRVHADYCQLREANNWPELTESAIYNWLHQTEQRKTWVLARHGKEVWIQEFGHKVVRDKSDWFPYCYIAIDGSKLDWVHYQDQGGKNYNMAARLYVNLLFDMYSESIIGYDFLVGKFEDHKSHFRTFKMGIAQSGKKPALITYDHQSGHKMESMQNLYNQLVTTNGGQHYPHRAKEHGSPVEQLIGRFQQQVLNTRWYSDKQSVKALRQDSRPNEEFIKKYRHKLKTPEQLELIFEECVEQWNAMKHPKYKESRNDVINHPQSYPLDKISTLDMMSLFWVKTNKPITYRNDGLKVTIGKEAYHYEVYDVDNKVDLDFRDKYIGCKFFVQYDADNLDNYVRLYLKLPNGQDQYVADAQPIKKIKNIDALMSEHDKNRKHQMLGVRDIEVENIQKELQSLRDRTGIDEESLIESQDRPGLEKFSGILPKKEREAAENPVDAWRDKM